MVLRLLCLLIPVTLVAQSSNGYLAAGIGSYANKLTSQYVLGGEWIAGKRIGVGGELGVLAGHNSFGFLNANVYYHFKPPATRPNLDPFVTAGLGTTLELFSSTEFLFNAGGGVHYWFHRHLGLRLELRDLIGAGNSAANSHIWGFRAGLALH